MAIFLNSDSRVIVQGMTGSEGRKHTQRMLASGTQIVGGVTPKKGGQEVEFESARVPVFNSVGEAVEATGANVTVIFVPAKFTKAAVVEAIEAEIPLAVVITEGVPVKDTRRVLHAHPGLEDPADRPELPRLDLTRAVERRHHPGRHHQGRPDRSGLEVGHADVPDDVRAPRHRLLLRRRASAAIR